MSRSHREPCGCRANSTHWIEMCPVHKGEFDEIHHRAKFEKDSREKHPVGPPPQKEAA